MVRKRGRRVRQVGRRDRLDVVISVLVDEGVGLESDVRLGEGAVQAARGDGMASGDEVHVVGTLMVVILVVVVGIVVGK